MFKENKILREVSRENRAENGQDKLKYNEEAYSDLDKQTRESFFEKRKKELGFSYVEGGEKTSVLISGSHAADLAKLNLKVSGEELDLLNQEEGKSKRYRKNQGGELLIGKHYIDAAIREKKSGDYRADPGVGAMGIELQNDLAMDSPEDAPNLLLYEMPQVFSEPNKVDAKNRSMAVVDLDVYQKHGMEKMESFIIKNGVGSISPDDVLAIKRGKYSEIANNEDDLDKREALLECEIALLRAKDNKAEYREISASLGVLKIHRRYYEKQEELLYGNPDVKFPTNLEIHTCFDTLKQREGFDVVIGTRMGSSVSDPEVEMILSLILRKHGFNVNLSSFNNFPINIGKREREGLKNFLESAEAVLEKEQNQIISEVTSIETREEILDKLSIVFDRRLEKMGDYREILIRFLEWKKKGDLLEQETTDNELKDMAKKTFFEEVTNFSDDDLRLLLKQNFANLFLSGKTHSDRLRGGLMGLSSLHDKFDAKSKYEKERGSEIRPEIIQIEIVSSIMKDSTKRKELESALKEFVSLIQEEDFDPREVLKRVINQ